MSTTGADFRCALHWRKKQLVVESFSRANDSSRQSELCRPEFRYGMATIKCFSSISLLVTKEGSLHLLASRSLRLVDKPEPAIHRASFARRRVALISLHAHGEALAASTSSSVSEVSAPSRVAQVVLTREKGKNKKLMQALVRDVGIGTLFPEIVDSVYGW